MEELPDYSGYLPEEALREVREAEERRVEHRARRRYPTSRDIVEAVVEASKSGIRNPHDFPDLVFRILEERGFDTTYVTIKRIWRTYESLVRRGVISDVLGVVI